MGNITITNQGEIQAEALSLLGASTKRDDEQKIGMFGSGNKYALAYFLRNGFEVEIYSGKEKIEIGTEPVNLRGENFEVITVNGRQTSITTETGPKWKLWQAIREIYCNAIDEGNHKLEVDKEIKPRHGHTTIAIIEKDGNRLRDFMNEFNKYFIDEKRDFLYRDELGQVFQPIDDQAGTFYRKGIRITTMTNNYNKTIFDYDFSDVKIDESRLIYLTSEGIRNAYRMMYQCDIPSVVSRFLRLCSNEDYLEYGGAGRSSFDPKLSPTWETVLKGKYVAPVSLGGWVRNEDKAHTIFVPSSLYDKIVDELGEDYNGLKGTTNGRFRRREVEASPRMKAMLKRASQFFEETNYDINYEIKVCEFSNRDILGQAEDQTIWLSKRIENEGMHVLVQTIMEEHCHLVSGYGDESREFQNHVFSEFINYMCKKNAFIL